MADDVCLSLNELRDRFFLFPPEFCLCGTLSNGGGEVMGGEGLLVTAGRIISSVPFGSGEGV